MINKMERADDMLRFVENRNFFDRWQQQRCCWERYVGDFTCVKVKVLK